MAEDVDLYGSQYGGFVTDLYREIRRDAFGEDIGQNGWLTATEQDRFIEWLALSPEERLLDVACGSGGPTLRICELTGCGVRGIDLHREGIARANESAEARELSDRADFEVVDASEPLPYAAGSYDAITCVDAINHLPDRPAVLSEWYRVLEPGGRVLFTDPIVVTGPLTDEEIAIRASVGFYLFVPDGEDDRLLERAGFHVEEKIDRTENMASMARRWHGARERRADELRRIEGDDYEGQQRFLDVCARLAREERLSRFVYLAVRP